MRKLLLNIAMLAALIMPVAVPTLAYADCPTPDNATTSKDQVLVGVGQTDPKCDGSGVDSIIKTIVNILSMLVGVIAVIMIVISGLKYITSGGNPEKASGAKSTLIYAMIGLAIAALTQVLIHFVLFQANAATTAPPADQTSTSSSQSNPQSLDNLHGINVGGAAAPAASD
jgi:hypothetical protein